MPANPSEEAKKTARLEHAALEHIAKERKLDKDEYRRLTLWCDILGCEHDKWCTQAKMRFGMSKLGVNYE